MKASKHKYQDLRDAFCKAMWDNYPYLCLGKCIEYADEFTAKVQKRMKDD